MKASEYLTRQYAVNWTKPSLPEAEIAALEGAYLAGFDKMKELVCGLLTDFDDPMLFRMSTLAMAIGNVEVDHETGKRMGD